MDSTTEKKRGLVLVQLGCGELRILNRLAINPYLSKAQLARELKVSRSAITQIWRNLEKKHKLRIRSNIDFKAFGLSYSFGWMEGDGNNSVSNFRVWVERNPPIVLTASSAIASGFKEVVYFEALHRAASDLESTIRQLERYQKRPYNLQGYFEKAESIENHFNFADFSGSTWDFRSDFRLGATMIAVKEYADVLPSPKKASEKEKIMTTLEYQVTGLALADNYHITAPELRNIFEKFDLDVPTRRTLQRRINAIRNNLASPYLYVENIALDEPVVVCISDPIDSNYSKMLQAQAKTFPSGRILTGLNTMVMCLDMPDSEHWLRLTEFFNEVKTEATHMCTFIAKIVPEVNLIDNFKRIVIS